MRAKKLTLVQGFFKADKPNEGGFSTALTLNPRNPNLDDIVNALETGYASFRNAPATEKADWLSHEPCPDGRPNVWQELEEAWRVIHPQQKKVHSHMDIQPATADENRFTVHVLLNILILEREGLLKSDEYNGMQYMYEQAGERTA